MTGDAWITLAVVLGALAALVSERLPPASVILGATISLLVLDVITPEQAFSGFSNPAPITVAALYVVSAGIERTGLVGPLVARILGERDEGRRTLARLTIPTAASSAVLNNTPIVATLIPLVDSWSSRVGRPASRMLMPLSFAAILGGVVTLIGTSTNLVVSGLLRESTGEGLEVFSVTPVGLPVAIVGLITVVVLAPLVLPDRTSAAGSLGSEAERDFVVQMVVKSGGQLDGETVASGGLRNLQGVFLVEVTRGDHRIAPVAPDQTLRGGDLLTFVGQVDLIVDLQRQPGLVSAEESHLMAVDDGRHTFFEAVIGPASPLVGRTLRDVEFRARYQAAVVAIHRAGQRIDAKFGDVSLRNGDTLLLLAGPDFRSRWGEGRDFLLVARLGGPPPSATRKAPWSAAILAAVVGLSAFEVLPILEASLLGAIATVAARIMTSSEARDSIDLDVILLIAASFGLGAAVDTSGLATTFADGLVGIFEPLGSRGVLIGIVLATVILTELITNNAAAVLMFPIAMSAGAAAGYSPTQIAVAVAIAASGAFLTPIGYQTNTMVYGPGGYRFYDYVRLGLPLNITFAIAIVAMVPIVIS